MRIVVRCPDIEFDAKDLTGSEDSSEVSFTPLFRKVGRGQKAMGPLVCVYDQGGKPVSAARVLIGADGTISLQGRSPGVTAEELPEDGDEEAGEPGEPVE